MKSFRTWRFHELYDALPLGVQRLADEAYEDFEADPNYPSLHFKSVGGDPPWYSARVGLKYRALCERAEDGTYVWFWIGSHADYDKLLRNR